MKHITLLEIVLGDWQKLPEELFTLSEDWKYIPGSVYTIANVELSRELTHEEQALLVRLKGNRSIVDGTSRTKEVSAEGSSKTLPEWAERDSSQERREA